MGTSLRRRRSFRPSLDGFRLEDRLVLSTANNIQADSITAAEVDPLVPTNHGTLKAGYVQATGTQLHAAFQTFINQTNRAAQNAIKGLGNGQTEANELASLKAFTALQGGTLESKVQQVSSGCPAACSTSSIRPRARSPAATPPTARAALTSATTSRRNSG